jgi:hypothetical protein
LQATRGHRRAHRLGAAADLSRAVVSTRVLMSPIVSHESRVSTQSMGFVTVGLGLGRRAEDPGPAQTRAPAASTIATALPLRPMRSSDDMRPHRVSIRTPGEGWPRSAGLRGVYGHSRSSSRAATAALDNSLVSSPSGKPPTIPAHARQLLAAPATFTALRTTPHGQTRPYPLPVREQRVRRV